MSGHRFLYQAADLQDFIRTNPVEEQMFKLIVVKEK